MDHTHCHVVYFDERARFDRWVRKDGSASAVANPPPGTSYFDQDTEEPDDLHTNILLIRAVYNSVYICNTSGAFISKISELNQTVGFDCTPILALVATDHSEFARPVIARNAYSREAITPSPTSFRRTLTREFSSSPEPEELHGLRLLARIHSDVESQAGPKVTMPIAILRTDSVSASGSHSRGPSDTSLPDELSKAPTLKSQISWPMGIEPTKMRKCLDAGALDVLTYPLDQSKIFALTSHAYRVHKEAQKVQSAISSRRQNRKRSWVGVNEEKPYAYLRESMVTKLMAGICNPESDEDTFHVQDIPTIEDSRDEDVAAVIGNWDFCAHDFTEDELVHAATLMLEHALRIPELEPWRLSRDELKRFLTASRNAYNSFVLYHNFKHAIDVLQSCFYFLLQIGTIPPYSHDTSGADKETPKSPIGSLLKPFDALCLLISAIGHDVGHPGVNNMFLVRLNAPLAQLYNDTSVLEAFHCAAFSQILRRYWPVAFEDRALRKLMISNILATDMGIHFKYMSDCGNLQERLHDNKGVDGWSPQLLETYKTLVCGLIIKCADISNVTRPWSVAERWTNILQLEFAKQGEMEQEVGIESALFGGPPEIGNVLKLGNGQIGFMNTFAYPLFESVTDLLPAMSFTVDEITSNRYVWTERVEQAKRKKTLMRSETTYTESGFVSPRSQSPVRRPGAGQSDGADDDSPHQSSTPPRWVAEHPPENRDSRRSSLASISHLVTGGTPKDQSRRSSMQSPFGIPVVSSTPEMTSRRSSGAFPGANPQPPPLLARRSSNTIPSSQLRLNNGGGMNGNHGVPLPNTEANESTPRSSNPNFGAAVLTSLGRGASTAQSTPDDSSTPRPDSRRRLFGRASPQNCSTGRISVPSSHTRDSQTTSGTRALSSVMAPVSPSTQATSFLTVDSDDKSLQNIDSRPHSSSMPAILDPSRGRHEAKNGVMTSVLGNGVAVGDSMRPMARRRSRLRLAFWRKNKSSDGST